MAESVRGDAAADGNTAPISAPTTGIAKCHLFFFFFFAREMNLCFNRNGCLGEREKNAHIAHQGLKQGRRKTGKK